MSAEGDGGRDLAQEENEPHILICAMPWLTPQVWDKLGRRPALFAFSPILLERRLAALEPPVDEIVPPFPVEKLIDCLCYGFPYADAVAEVRRQLNKIRRDFELTEDEPLRVSIIGNESRMAVMMGAGYAQDCEGFGAYMIQEAVRERRLSGLLEAALHRLDNIVLVPQTALPGAVKPKLNCPRDFQQRIGKMRAEIDRVPLKQLKRGTMLRLPAAVRLYVRNHRLSRWRPMTLEDPLRASFGEADLLIDAFNLLRHDARESNRQPPEGILVKIIGTDAARHATPDLPMLTASQHELAGAAGIKAIILDARGAIWNISGEGRLDEKATPPVYGA